MTCASTNQGFLEHTPNTTKRSPQGIQKGSQSTSQTQTIFHTNHPNTVIEHTPSALKIIPKDIWKGSPSDPSGNLGPIWDATATNARWLLWVWCQRVLETTPCGEPLAPKCAKNWSKNDKKHTQNQVLKKWRRRIENRAARTWESRFSTEKGINFSKCHEPPQKHKKVTQEHPKWVPNDATGDQLNTTRVDPKTNRFVGIPLTRAAAWIVLERKA